MEEEKTNQIPKLSPKYLTDNHLWDSEWLMEKYPDNHLQDPDWFEKQRTLNN